MKPAPIYDNLNSVWRNPITWDKVSTETWLHTHEVKRICKDILLGVVSGNNELSDDYCVNKITP